MHYREMFNVLIANVLSDRHQSCSIAVQRQLSKPLRQRVP